MVSLASSSWCPCKVIEPCSGRRSPSIRFSRVLFPHPLGPTRASNSPSETISGIVQYHLPTDQLIGLVMSFFISIGDLIAAFVEELAYRYESMYTFRTKGKLVTGIMVIVSSLLFGFSHYYNFNGSFVATMPYVFAGLVLALGYLKTKNFWVPALAHLLFNSIALLSTIFLLIVFIIQKIVG